MKLYMRVCEINLNGRVLNAPPMSIDFETTFSFSSAQTKAKIYNPSPDTVAACEKTGKTFPKVIISAGYQADSGTCVTGEITAYTFKKANDDVLELTIGDCSSLWNNAIVNKSWKGEITAETVIRQLLAEVGVTVSRINLDQNKVYTRGIAFPGVPLKKAMQKIASDCGATFFFRNGQACFLNNPSGYQSAFVLNYNSGLLKAEKKQNGYKITSLFLYNLGAGSLIKLANGTILKVQSGKSVFSIKNRAYTECKAVRI